MELWIRSQEKDHLVKVEEINIEIDDDGFIGIWSYGSNKYLKWYLGHYATKERALEVLDEIQKFLKPHLIIKDNEKIIGSFEDTIIREGATYELKELSTYVYEMPKDRGKENK